MAHAIDTLRIARKLESAGVDRRHAEAQLNEVVVTEYSELATKTDLERCATKVDLERFATKEDLERFATKADLERFATKEDLERFPTKEYLHEVLKNFATKADLERFVTKEYLHEALKNLRHQGGSRQPREENVPAVGDLDGHLGDPHRQHAVRGRLTPDRPSLHVAHDCTAAFTPAEPRERTPPGSAIREAEPRPWHRPRPRPSDPAHPAPAAPRASSRAEP